MKQLIKRTTLSTALVIVGLAAAHADMSIEQSRSFQQGGQTQTQTYGVKPGDFDAGAIAFALFQPSPQLIVYGITPTQPSTAALESVKRAVMDYMPPAPLGAGRLYGVASQVYQWAAWGVDSGWLDADYFGRLTGSCVTSHLGEFQSGVPWAAMPSSTTACAVSAYLQAYSVNPRGYVAGNLMGLVPLCEVAQKNDCNITGGAFNPWAIYRQRQEQAAAQAQANLRAAQSRAQEMHEQAYQRYLRLTGKAPQ